MVAFVSKKPLTPKMRDLLVYLQKGGRVHFMSGWRGECYYWRADTHAHCTGVLMALHERALVELPDPIYGDKLVKLTAKGKEIK